MFEARDSGFQSKIGLRFGIQKYARDAKNSPRLRDSTNVWVGITGLKLGVRDLRAKSWRESGLKLCERGEIPKITIGILE